MILNRLKQLGEASADNFNIDNILYELAKEIDKKSSSQLKKIISILNEFDNHDSDHSKSIISYIENILGLTIIEKLTKYELFLLFTSAYLHDIGMALPDWELNCIDIIENQYELNKHTNTFSYKDSVEFISRNKKKIYNNFEEQCKKWFFGFKEENELICYLAKVCIEYQKLRNCESKIGSDKEHIKITFIRQTHNERSFTYINNLKHHFKDKFREQGWAEKLCGDLAQICRLHCTQISEIEKLDNKRSYMDNLENDLQLVASLLRIGDILDYSYNRAPNTLRESKIFKSSYSLEQWLIKSESISVYIKDNAIYFSGYFQKPEFFYKIHKYLDWVDYELGYLNSCVLVKNNKYNINLKPTVIRDKIDYDKEIFKPKLGVKFSIDNNKILKLLMSTGLYKDEFACLRELYQNSIDACNFRYEKLKSKDLIFKGKVEFGINHHDDHSTLFCHDNGIGMDQNIIENYLLNIGNSFYTSNEFYKEQSYWSNSFSPISKFGIGILSCFMLGDKLEIVTKKENSDYFTFVIDKSNEYFYYKNTTEVDKEMLNISGTIVKIYLNDERLNNIYDFKIEKLGYFLAYYNISTFNIDPTLKTNTSNWDKHIYNHVNKFISEIPDTISVNVKDIEGNIYPILSKPINIDDKVLGLNKEDFNLFNEPEFGLYHGDDYIRALECLKVYKLKVSGENYNYTFILQLPLNNFNESDNSLIDKILTTNERMMSLNGIKVDNHFSSMSNVLNSIQFNGGINFIGEDVPEISIDRNSFTKLDESMIDVDSLSNQIANIVIETFIKHIKENNIQEYSYAYNFAWNHVMRCYSFLSYKFLKKISSTELGQVKWDVLCKIASENIDILTFVNKQELSLKIQNFYDLSFIIKELIEYKLVQANEIKIVDDEIQISKTSMNQIEYIKDYRTRIDRISEILIYADCWKGLYEEYDIVTGIGQIIPKRLFDKYCQDEISKFHHNRFINFHLYSNGIAGLFMQDPVLVNPDLGLYNFDSGFRNTEKSRIYSFDKKVKNIYLNEINIDPNNICLLYAYISPRALTEDEEKDLQKYELKNPNYVKGVREGWSIILTTLKTQNLIIKPGIQKRSEMFKDMNNIFITEDSSRNYHFSDNTNVNDYF